MSYDREKDPMLIASGVAGLYTPHAGNGKQQEARTGDWVDRFEESIGIWLKPKLSREELRKLGNFIHYEIMSRARQATQPSPQSLLSELSTFPAKWKALAKVSERVGGQEMCAEELEGLLRRHHQPECRCYRYEPDRDTQRADVMTGGDGGGWMVTQDCPIHRQVSQVSGEPGQARFPHWESAYQLHKRENILMGEAVESVVQGASQAMAEKAAQLCERYANLCVGGAITGDTAGPKLRDTAKDIRSLAGAEPQPIITYTKDGEPLGLDPLQIGAVEPPQDKIREAVSELHARARKEAQRFIRSKTLYPEYHAAEVAYETVLKLIDAESNRLAAREPGASERA